ncbi:type III pantothenate kinase [Prolixibacteraceae bacterium JC049]|nr:type III pantothenate kinase [Prolixibacteraceae bacterium JC049]
MNLIIDIGNTRGKVAFFSNGKMNASFSQSDITVEDLKKWKQNHPELENVIISSVRILPQQLLVEANALFDNVIELTHSTPVPIQNLYKTPETLGADRLAAAIGANSLHPDTPILIVDAGTAITYELVNDKNQYLGGNISPGLNTRFKALHHFTGKLPLLKADEINAHMGQNTAEAIIQGVVIGMVYEIEGYINQLKMSYPKLKVFLTGGDANFFDKKLKNSIFVDFNLIMYGLNRILEFNVK